MRFLADQDVYAATIRFLIGLGHDVIPASQAGLSRAEDLTLVRTAEKEGRILLTRDRDFGSLVFVQGIGKGVIIFASFHPTSARCTLSLNVF